MILRAARLYVISIVFLTVLATVTTYFVAPQSTLADWKAGATFGCLVAISYLLAYKKTGRNESGSIAFLPLLAAVYVAPTLSTILSTAAAMAVVELVNRRPLIKGIFNVAQAALAVGVSILLYVEMGGVPLTHQGFQPAAFVASLFLFIVVNTFALSGVIAASEQKSFTGLLKQRGPKTLIYDLYALPFVYVFAWVYVQYGLFGAVALVLPIMGVRELYKMNWELQTANQELLELMVAAIEARDPYTSGHSRRVSASARLICEAMGLRERVIERVVTSALLHDVGKIHEVFATILSKPSRLTNEELAIMKTHPVKSEELVRMVSKLKDLAAPIRHHHENWDGTGYPDGLIGEAIPLGSRIIMFADTIDAMTTDRPYRVALTANAVRAELKKYRGIQFDPKICDLILQGGLVEALTGEVVMVKPPCLPAPDVAQPIAT